MISEPCASHTAWPPFARHSASTATQLGLPLASALQVCPVGHAASVVQTPLVHDSRLPAPTGEQRIEPGSAQASPALRGAGLPPFSFAFPPPLPAPPPTPAPPLDPATAFAGAAPEPALPACRGEPIPAVPPALAARPPFTPPLAAASVSPASTPTAASPASLSARGSTHSPSCSTEPAGHSTAVQSAVDNVANAASVASHPPCLRMSLSNSRCSRLRSKRVGYGTNG
jgi:hypothetical protein